MRKVYVLLFYWISGKYFREYTKTWVYIKLKLNIRYLESRKDYFFEMYLHC